MPKAVTKLAVQKSTIKSKQQQITQIQLQTANNDDDASNTLKRKREDDDYDMI